MKNLPTKIQRLKNYWLQPAPRLRLVGAALLATGLVIIPVGCGTDSSSGNNTPDNSSSGLTESFSENCASCHGAAGQGTATGRALLGYERDSESFKNQVRNGGGNMQAFSTDVYSDEDLLTDYTWLISNPETR